MRSALFSAVAALAVVVALLGVCAAAPAQPAEAPLTPRAPAVLFESSCAGCPPDAFCEFGREGTPPGHVACVDYGEDSVHNRRSLYRRYEADTPAAAVVSTAQDPEYPYQVTGSTWMASGFKTPASGKLKLIKIVTKQSVLSGSSGGPVTLKLVGHNPTDEVPDVSQQFSSVAGQTVTAQDPNYQTVEYDFATPVQLSASTNYCKFLALPPFPQLNRSAGFVLQDAGSGANVGFIGATQDPPYGPPATSHGYEFTDTATTDNAGSSWTRGWYPDAGIPGGGNMGYHVQEIWADE
ncbi:hypothetical protein DFJ74DRAFT_682011 [Hyaloraphidium curvatum]|nr:hypothetical protein DFJ74DRAFT_682011 [Hyaloraphidium curvatum]